MSSGKPSLIANWTENPPADDKWLTTVETAADFSSGSRLGASIDGFVREGPVFHRIGGRIFYRRSAVEAFIAAGEMKQAPHQAPPRRDLVMVIGEKTGWRSSADRHGKSSQSAPRKPPSMAIGQTVSRSVTF